MTAQHIYTALSGVVFVLAMWQWIGARRDRRLRERLDGLDRWRWDRLVPAGDGPKLRIEPPARGAAKQLLELAVDGGKEALAQRCRGAAGEEFAEAIEVCRLVSGYLVISQCPPWPLGDERLRRVASNIQDGLLPAEITRREIRDCLRDALTGPRPRDAEGRLPGSEFPSGEEAVVVLLVTGWLLLRCRPKNRTWPDYLDWVCYTLNAAGRVSLELIPALIQRAQGQIPIP